MVIGCNWKHGLHVYVCCCSVKHDSHTIRHRCELTNAQAAMDLLVLAQHGSNKEARAALMLGPEKYDAWLHGTRIEATKLVDFRSTNSYRVGRNMFDFHPRVSKSTLHG